MRMKPFAGPGMLRDCRLYDGTDAAFALRDAWLEAGVVKFAEHFRDAAHPKGCAWLDAILGKS